jgi:hypothetical protein
MADQVIVGGGQVERSADVFERDNQNVKRRLGIDVLEGNHLVVTVDLPGLDLSGGDFTEKAIFAHIALLSLLLQQKQLLQFLFLLR